jgi:nitroreductase
MDSEMHRRAFMRLMGGGAVFAAATPLAACAPGPDPAEAWREPGASERDLRRFVLAHALLAPNPHNRQPWMARLLPDGGLDLFIDRSRLLPVTDPFSRQIVIGCGAFLELLALAAGARGHEAVVTPFPDGQPADTLDARPFARVKLIPSRAPIDPLFPQITLRRSNKDPYEKDRVVPPADLAALAASVAAPLRFGVAEAGPVLAEMKALTEEAFRKEVDTPAAYMESVRLMRIGAAEVAAHRDGIDLTGLPIEVMKATGLMTREAMARPGSFAHDQARGLYGPLARTASAFVWIVSPDNDRLSQIAAGRAYARLNLTATALGLAMHPMSQALQEFREMAPLKARVDRMVGAAGQERLQMLARIGYGRDVPASPRRGLAAHLVEAAP